jgi:hypothetical protein
MKTLALYFLLIHNAYAFLPGIGKGRPLVLDCPSDQRIIGTVLCAEIISYTLPGATYPSGKYDDYRLWKAKYDELEFECCLRAIAADLNGEVPEEDHFYGCSDDAGLNSSGALYLDFTNKPILCGKTPISEDSPIAEQCRPRVTQVGTDYENRTSSDCNLDASPLAAEPGQAVQCSYGIFEEETTSYDFACVLPPV